MNEITFEEVKECVSNFCHTDVPITPETFLGADLGIKDKRLAWFLSVFIKKFEVRIDRQYTFPGFYSKFSLVVFGMGYGLFYLLLIRSYSSWVLEISFFLISFLLFAIVISINIKKFMNNAPNIINNSTVSNKDISNFIAFHKLDFTVNDLVDIANSKKLFKKFDRKQ